jgi:hypothetical protein
LALVVVVLFKEFLMALMAVAVQAVAVPVDSPEVAAIPPAVAAS